MNGDILVCDTTSSLGRLMVRRFMNLGVPAKCCRSSLSVIKNKLLSDELSGVVIFAMRPDNNILSLIKLAQSRSIPVFVGLFTRLASVHASFRDAGAAYTFTMPASTEDICRSIVLRLDSNDDIQGKISIFLEEFGFPRNLSGFGYLTRAAELFIEAPDRLWGNLGDIYEEIAEEFSTKSSLVERSMRNLGKKSAENGSVAKLTEGRITQMPTNTELICAVCDAFFRQPYK